MELEILASVYVIVIGDSCATELPRYRSS